MNDLLEEIKRGVAAKKSENKTNARFWRANAANVHGVNWHEDEEPVKVEVSHEHKHDVEELKTAAQPVQSQPPQEVNVKVEAEPVRVESEPVQVQVETKPLEIKVDAESMTAGLADATDSLRRLRDDIEADRMKPRIVDRPTDDGGIPATDYGRNQIDDVSGNPLTDIKGWLSDKLLMGLSVALAGGLAYMGWNFYNQPAATPPPPNVNQPVEQYGSLLDWIEENQKHILPDE